MTEFQLLDIWSKFYRKVIISHDTHTHTHSRVCSDKSGETAHSLHSVEAGWKLKVQPTACAVSHLIHLAWDNVMTNVTHGGRVCSYRPRPPTLYTVCWQLAAIYNSGQDDRPDRVSLWVGQTNDVIYDVTIARHQTLRSHIQCHPHNLPGLHQSINKLINQATKANIYSALFCEPIRRTPGAQRPPTTSISHAMTACHTYSLLCIVFSNIGTYL